MRTLLASVALCFGPMLVQGQPVHAQKPARLIVRNATIVEGNGTPAQGPLDILVQNGMIEQIGRVQAKPGDVEIDAKGKYVLPGLVDLHVHIQTERANIPQDVNYCLKLWLACGITTVRDVGSDTALTLDLRAKSAKGEVAAPRIYAYPVLGRPRNAEAAVARVRELKQQGADGFKIIGIHRDTMDAALAEAHAQGLPVAHHMGVEETNAWDAIRNQVTSIEHWYGIPDAAIADGVQNFPSNYNYLNEADRFRWAGHLWREADPARLTKVLDAMIANNVAWDPTLEIYEASRDLQRAQTQPWFKDYLHPALAEFFRPNLKNHGSYFINWSTADETFWKENYRLWMSAIRQFEARGGLLGMGDDAGFIYQMYGFGMLRNFELYQEAGFHPLKIVQQATLNGARILGKEKEFGRVRAGWKADFIVVNGNPLEDFKLLYPCSPNTGTPTGIEWTVKEGITYHVPTLMNEIKAIVDKARAETGTKVETSKR
jgi:imidazolonepropionase-like amidohydrolase